MLYLAITEDFGYLASQKKEIQLCIPSEDVLSIGNHFGKYCSKYAGSIKSSSLDPV